MPSRFGHILSPGDLDSLLPSPSSPPQDPAVALHVERLKALKLSQQRRRSEPPTGADDDDMGMPSATAAAAAAAARTTAPAAATGAPAAGPDDAARARVRNRRYRRLRQLAQEGSWFSDEAMKERDPWLWFEHVGRRAGEERPAPKQAVEEVG